MAGNIVGDTADPRGRRKRLIFGFGALLILAILFAAIAQNAQNTAAQRREVQRWFVHSYEVLMTAEALKGAANQAMRGERGYLITDNARFLEPHRKAVADVPQLLTRLETLTRDNGSQQRHILALRTGMERYLGLLDRVIALHQAGKPEAATAIVRSGVGMREIEGVLATLGQIEAEENRLRDQRSAANERANATIERYYYILSGIGLALLLVAGAAGLSAMRAQRRVHHIAEQLRVSATTDELTGLCNRRFFMHALDIEVARARRNGAPLSVAVADIDHFKRVNDKYGHAGGDEVLRSLAKIFEAIMRTGDVVGRLGGEEFAILMPDTDEIQARIACERLRGAIAGRKIRLPSGEEIPITLSTGIALLVPGDDRDKLVNRADGALYSAKEGGRNQVRLAA